MRASTHARTHAPLHTPVHVRMLAHAHAHVQVPSKLLIMVMEAFDGEQVAQGGTEAVLEEVVATS